ncbi:unnamed protein product [Pleuronectes platessa]|uniref:Uncharacterized protein n=1 Tax=Pleuronectes platessa TaxID=8262 RepID=A0A9N7TJH3_PLEPL|nr:unnamed protein product [Pleuronectes platessa]
MTEEVSDRVRQLTRAIRELQAFSGCSFNNDASCFAAKTFPTPLVVLEEGADFMSWSQQFVNKDDKLATSETVLDDATETNPLRRALAAPEIMKASQGCAQLARRV